jgi:hypothetical protein
MAYDTFATVRSFPEDGECRIKAIPDGSETVICGSLQHPSR